MATYEGVILTDTESLNHAPTVFNAIKLPVVNDYADLEQTVFVARKAPFFILGNQNEVAGKKVRRLLGHTTWGDGNTPPRLYPLETSWTRKKV